MCTDGSCVLDPYMCPIIPACPPQFFRCSDGSCRLGAPGSTASSVCPAAPSCPAGKSICEDGICRAKCLQFNGCGLDLPYACLNRECASIADDSPNGACASAKTAIRSGFSRRLMAAADLPTAANDVFATWSATGTIFKDSNSFFALAPSYQWRFAAEQVTYFGHPCGYGLNPLTCSCSTSDPPVCSNNATGGVCQPSLDSCYGDADSLKLTFAVNSTKTVTLASSVSAGVALAHLIIPGASLPLAKLVVRPVGRSRMVTAQHVVDYTRQNDGFGVFMSFADTLISPAFECLTSSPVPEPFAVNITYVAQIDLQRYPDYRDVCLGYIQSTISPSGRTFSNWQCVYQNPTDRMANPVISVSDLKAGQVNLDSQRTSPLGLASSTFGRCGAGTIYGFIHSPLFIQAAQAPSSSNWVNQYLVYVFIGLALVSGVLVFSLYACSRLLRYRKVGKHIMCCQFQVTMSAFWRFLKC